MPRAWNTGPGTEWDEPLEPGDRGYKAPRPVKPAVSKKRHVSPEEQSQIDLVTSALAKKPSKILSQWLALREANKRISLDLTNDAMSELQARGLEQESFTLRRVALGGGAYSFDSLGETMFFSGDSKVAVLLRDLLTRAFWQKWLSDTDLLWLYQLIENPPESVRRGEKHLALLKRDLDDITGGKENLGAGRAPRMPKPETPVAKLVDPGSSSERTTILRAAVGKKPDAFLEKALTAIQQDAGWFASADADTLKTIRHELYKRGMKKEADMFRTESRARSLTGLIAESRIILGLTVESGGTFEVLQGHESESTAYVVDDYPYGFTARTKIRYWLETDKKKGARFVSQTLNPKTQRWNAPKKSTYAWLGGVMFLDMNQHVSWDGLSEYSSAEQIVDFLRKYPGSKIPSLKVWAKAKAQFAADLASGKKFFTVNGVKKEPTEQDIERNTKEAEMWNDIVAKV